jgi:hypothetical protein
VAEGWLLLAASLPGRDASTARVRLWRALKDFGAANLRDGVTLAPRSPVTADKLEAIAADVEASGGSAWLLEMPPQGAAVERKLRDLFDRSQSYVQLKGLIVELRAELTHLDEADARAKLRELEAEVDAVVALDYFPGNAQAHARDSVEKLRAALNRKFSPAEPSSTHAEVSRRDPRRFRKQRWATRKRLWVDRVASAWLIRRFIDRDARFVWLERPADCPRNAHGFDFDGATFTHVGERVTFEVLLASFGLDDDPALERLARLVHFLDVGGEAVAEAAGFEAVLAGLRAGAADDDVLLRAATPVLDALYQHFAHARE